MTSNSRLTPDTLGTIQISTPTIFWAISIISFCFVGSGMAYLAFAHYTPRLSVSGTIVPVSGSLLLDTTAAGQVTRVDVRQGERVTAGQTIAEFSSHSQYTSSGRTLRFPTAKVDEESAALRQELKMQRVLVVSHAIALRTSAVNSRAQVAQIQEQLTSQAQKVARMTALLRRMVLLSRNGNASVDELKRQETEPFNARLKVKVSDRRRLAITHQISAEQEQLAKLMLRLVAQQTAIHREIAKITQLLAMNELQREWALKAPVAGIISSLHIKFDEAVTNEEPVATLVPRGAVLDAQLLVQSSNIGLVHTGQQVILRYRVFPYQEYGLSCGTVTHVSRSALTPQDVAVLVGERTPLPVYRVMVRLWHQHSKSDGRYPPLLPGMSVKASILQDRRRLIAWIFGPLDGFARRAHSKLPLAACRTEVPFERENGYRAQMHVDFGRY